MGNMVNTHRVVPWMLLAHQSRWRRRQIKNEISEDNYTARAAAIPRQLVAQAHDSQVRKAWLFGLVLAAEEWLTTTQLLKV
jgi:hypothetical protein